jgi:hypothetical protein
VFSFRRLRLIIQVDLRSHSFDFIHNVDKMLVQCCIVHFEGALLESDTFCAFKVRFCVHLRQYLPRVYNIVALINFQISLFRCFEIRLIFKILKFNFWQVFEFPLKIVIFNLFLDIL